MLQDMAVPDIAKLCSRGHWGPSREIEFGDDARDLTRKCLHGVLPGRPLVRGGLNRRAGENQVGRVPVYVERLPVENLELHEVEMDGMGILSRVDQIPDFYRADLGILGDWLIPESAKKWGS
jgi:hypothetical protein